MYGEMHTVCTACFPSGTYLLYCAAPGSAIVVFCLEGRCLALLDIAAREYSPMSFDGLLHIVYTIASPCEGKASTLITPKATGISRNTAYSRTPLTALLAEAQLSLVNACQNHPPRIMYTKNLPTAQQFPQDHLMRRAITHSLCSIIADAHQQVRIMLFLCCSDNREVHILCLARQLAVTLVKQPTVLA